jgi:uncharacterized protein YjaG (DUF416 family)
MNRQARVALIIGSLVVVTASIGVGVFVALGSQVGIVVILVGIPSVLIVSGVLYVRATVGGRNMSTHQFTDEQAKQAARDLQDLGRTFVQLQEKYPGWTGEDVDKRLEEIIASMANVGVEYDRSANSFQVDEVQGSFQEIQTIRGEVESTKKILQESFTAFVYREIERLDEARAQLSDAGLATDVEGVDPDELPDDEEDWTVETASAYLDDQRSAVVNGVTEAIGTIRRKLEVSDASDPEPVENSLSDAESKLETGSPTEAVSAVVRARRALDDQLSGTTEETREQVVALADTILDSTATAHLDREALDAVESIRREAETLDSGLDFQEAERLREDLRRRAIDMIESLQTELRDHATTLSNADLPGGFYTPPDSIDVDYVGRLDSTAAPAQFRQGWQDAAKTLAVDIEDADTKISVVEAYDDVAEDISEKLQAEGLVTHEDLPVKQPQQFLGLYYRRNEGLSFDPDVPALRREEVDSYTVVVEPSVEGEDDVVVNLELDGEFASKEDRVFAGGVTSFESVPPGEYVITASAGGEFSPVERSVTVEDDERVSLALKETSLRDRLCEDVDDVGQYVAEFEDDIQSRFDTDGYVDSDLDLPVDPDFVPCLLATWAERNGLIAVEAEDGSILVFDRDQQATEIRNVIQFNLEPGGSLSYDQVRSDFLSVPIPDMTIRKIAKSVTDDPAVHLTETEIMREPEGD